MMTQLISIILPIYNQADHIEHIVREYTEALARIQTPCEIILVTNGCGDNSPKICGTLAREYAIVRAIHSEESGWGRAVKLGLAEAQGDILCYTNSARTSPQNLVLLLFYGFTYPNVVIKANRKNRENWPRRLGSLLYNLECRSFFDLSYWDINGTPKVFPRRFNKLLRLSRNDDLIDLEFNLICRREDYPMLEVPIFSGRRYGGKSTTNYRSALKMYLGAYELRRMVQKDGK